MQRFPENFMLGAATAAHQVEGNNIYSDSWALEHLPHTTYAEPSDLAVDHYHRYEEDLALMAKNGLNAYRFTVEWARIEPQRGVWKEEEVEHYRRVLQCCHRHGITPMVTMHHFSSPKWLIEQGGWENPQTADLFAGYCERLVRELGELMIYVNTINEANMGLQFAKLVERMMKGQTSGNSVQIGRNSEMQNVEAYMKESGEAFGRDPRDINVFLSARTRRGDSVIMDAHRKARDAMKAACPHLKIGISLSLHDIQSVPGGEKEAAMEWDEEFMHYLPVLREDDFLGVQSYTRKIIGPDGEIPLAPDAPRTQNDYEDYPAAVVHVTRRVAEAFPGDLIITENGIGTDDDDRRIEFIREALEGIAQCVEDGLPVRGYLHWSLLDNYEWQAGFSKTFGLVAVDRKTQTRHPKESLAFLGSYARSGQAEQ